MSEWPNAREVYYRANALLRERRRIERAAGMVFAVKCWKAAIATARKVAPDSGSRQLDAIGAVLRGVNDRIKEGVTP